MFLDPRAEFSGAEFAALEFARETLFKPSAVLSADASASAAFSGGLAYPSTLTASGSATASFVSQAGALGLFSASASATASFVGADARTAVFGIAPQATAAFSGGLARYGQLSASAAATAEFIALSNETIFDATVVASAVFVGETLQQVSVGFAAGADAIFAGQAVNNSQAPIARG